MTNEDKRVPDLLVELYLLGELGPEQSADVERRLRAEDGGMARIEAIRQSDADILNDYPVSVMSRRIERLAELKGSPERSSPYEPSRSQRTGWVLAAAALLLGGIATVLILISGVEQAPYVSDTNQGGAATDSLGQTQEEVQNGEVEDSERAWRNARAKELKSKLERGKRVSEDDVDTTGLVLAMERKASRAMSQGNRREMVATCRGAREIDPDACPWLEGELARLDAQEWSEWRERQGDAGSDARPDQRTDSNPSREHWKAATKAIVKGDWNTAISECSRGLELGERRCHRVLGLCYKNLGDEQRACEHFRKIGVRSHEGLQCD